MRLVLARSPEGEWFVSREIWREVEIVIPGGVHPVTCIAFPLALDQVAREGKITMTLEKNGPG